MPDPTATTPAAPPGTTTGDRCHARRPTPTLATRRDRGLACEPCAIQAKRDFPHVTVSRLTPAGTR